MSKSEHKRRFELGEYIAWIEDVRNILAADPVLVPDKAHDIIEHLVYGGWTPPSAVSEEKDEV